MKRLLGLTGAFLIASLCATVPAFAASSDEQIAQAVTPLPEDLRPGATVVVYDQATGERRVLRQGTSTLECEPENPRDGFTRCYSNVSRPRRELEEKLRAEKKSDKEIQAAVDAAITSGLAPGRFAKT